MTTIKSTNGQTDLWIGKEHAGGRFVRIEREDAGAADRFPAADILAALGVDELGCGCDEADQNLKKALARAEEAEAEALEQAKLVRTWADRAEKAESEHEATKKAYRDLGANHAKLMERLAEAEATIERVREIAENSYNSSWLALKGILAALTPPKRFDLPTRVPARIEAKRDYHGWVGELELWSNGEQQRFWRCEYDGQDYTPDGVMALFTEHRLVEPES